MAPERPEVTKKVTGPPALATAARTRITSTTKAPARDRSPGPLSDQMSGTVKIVDYSPQQEGKVFFGARVEIENDEGDIKRFRIVGYDEIFGRKDYISIDSPMARALLKKRSAIWPSLTRRRGSQLVCQRIEYVK